MRLIKSLAIIVIVGTLLGSREGLAAENPFIMTTSVSAPLYFEDGSGLYNLLVAEIFKRLGIEYELVWLPSQRSLAFTNNGTDDGNIARTAGIEKKFTNLIRVPEKVFDFEFMAYTKSPVIDIDDWSSLQPYAVGIINGWKIVERNVNDAKLVTPVNNYEQLLTLLDKERVDVAILDRVMGGWKLKQLGFDLAAIEPPIVRKPMFIYVHKKHVQLVPEIARVVIEMKKDGTFREIFAKALPDYQLE